MMRCTAASSVSTCTSELTSTWSAHGSSVESSSRNCHRILYSMQLSNHIFRINRSRDL